VIFLISLSLNFFAIPLVYDAFSDVSEEHAYYSRTDLKTISNQYCDGLYTFEYEKRTCKTRFWMTVLEFLKAKLEKINEDIK
jgi:hypothetical protein